jgi:hypothetical protein
MLRKAFHVNFSDVEFNESILGNRIFVKLSIKEMKEFMVNHKLPPFNQTITDENFPGNIAMSEGDFVVLTLRAEKRVSGKENPAFVYWAKNEMEKLIIEFVLVVNCMTIADSVIYEDINEDERIVDVISD